jgi:8-oxo-dGTP diphosphatase
VSPADEDELRFLAAYDASAFPKPSVAVDVVLVTTMQASLQAVLMQRRQLPHRGRWSVPGTFLGLRESLEDAAQRVLTEKVGLDGVYVEQLYTFGAPDRDPRTRVLSIAYMALVHADRFADLPDEVHQVELRVPWAGELGGPVHALDDEGVPMSLAFDHADLLGMAVQRMRGKLNYTPIGYQLLPARFTLRALQTVHETVLGRPLNKDSFRRRMLASGELEATGEREHAVRYRPAELYRFVRRQAV